jgi:hypothetical protein
MTKTLDPGSHGMKHCDPKMYREDGSMDPMAYSEPSMAMPRAMNNGGMHMGSRITGDEGGDKTRFWRRHAPKG